jgi:hypothetical protein
MSAQARHSRVPFAKKTHAILFECLCFVKRLGVILIEAVTSAEGRAL